MPPAFVSVGTPSLPSWSVAYSSSFRAASMSGSGREAKCPNRPGWARRTSAPASLTCRGQLAGGGGVAEPDTGRGDRQDGGRDAPLVHQFQVPDGAPGGPAGSAVGVEVPDVLRGLDVVAGQEVGVHVH